MMKNILIAVAVAALPVLAQDAPAPQMPPCGGAPKCHRPCGEGDMHKRLLEKFDTNKDGQLDEQEKEAMKAALEARRAERPGRGHGHGPKGPRGHRPDCEQKLLEKFDTNKDGQLDEQEKEAMKAALDARRAERQQKLLEKFDTNKDGQLDEQEKEAMKAALDARRGERPGRGHGHAPKGPRGHRGHGPGHGPAQGCDCKG